MQLKEIKPEAHFVALFLAKFSDAYKLLGMTTQDKTHDKFAKIFNMGKDSFKMLRDEYDAFYDNRKGFTEAKERKPRINYFKEFDRLPKNNYVNQVLQILKLSDDASLSILNLFNEEEDILLEGTSKKTIINRYERNILARAKCLEYYGRICYVCGFIDGENYKENIIEVHHIKQISLSQSQKVIDPINDLVPLCPNCHSAIHSKNPCYSIKEFKENIFIS